MRKFLLSGGVLVASIAYIAYQYIGGGAASAAGLPAAQQSDGSTVSVSDTAGTPASTPSAQPTQTTTVPPQQTTSPTPAPTPTPAPKPSGQYVDGTYTGSSADAYYGTVQVRAIISGGKLTNVTFLQFPNDRSTSRYINGQAMPQLKQEAIAAQSASVNGVSGATDTSQAFVQSLSSALARAKNS